MIGNVINRSGRVHDEFDGRAAVTTGHQDE